MSLTARVPEDAPEEHPGGDDLPSILTALCDHVPGLVAYIDRQERYLFASRSHERFLPFPRESMVGKRLTEAIGTRNYLRIAPYIKAALSGREIRFEAPMEDDDPPDIRLELHLIPDRDPRGAVRGVLAYAHDVTERKRSLDALRESEARFHALADNTPVLISAADTDGRQNYFNRRWLEFRGRALEEEQGTGWLEGIHPDDREKVIATFSSAFEARREYSVEMRLRRHDGEYRWMIGRGVAHFGADGAFRGFIHSYIDIHDRKTQEQERGRILAQLSNALRIRDDFMAIASHELKTPITSMNLQIDLLRRGLASAEPGDLRGRVERSIEVSARQVRRLNRLVEEMLDVSRISRLRPFIRREAFDLVEAVSETVARIRESPSARGIPIRLNAVGRVPGEWDRVRIEQIVENLMLNAIRYGRGNPVDVSVSREGDLARIRVIDRGIGIPPDALKRIFERFGVSSRPEQAGGLGLGLYLTRILVEAHGGSIRAESEPGEGSVFTVELPIAGT